MPRASHRLLARATILLPGGIGFAGCMELLAPASEGERVLDVVQEPGIPY